MWTIHCIRPGRTEIEIRLVNGDDVVVVTFQRSSRQPVSELRLARASRLGLPLDVPTLIPRETRAILLRVARRRMRAYVAQFHI